MNREQKKYCFLGIGGIGMSALAKYLFEQGERVMGYDKTPSNITEQLISMGIPVVFEDSISALPEDFRTADTQIVYTPALPKDHSQLNYFKTQGNNIKKRAVLLGEVTANSIVFAIAGTHGKTTTASILTHLFACMNLEFTAFLGGIMNTFQSNFISNGNIYSIVEADEYDHSFLQLRPDYACVTSMDKDHLDIYGNQDNMKKAFRQFADLADQKVIMAKGLELEGISYAVGEKANFYAKNIQPGKSGYHFDLVTPDKTHEGLYLSAIGRHNLSNAIAAVALLNTAGLTLEKALPALGTFKGIFRRMELIALENKLLIDDYAHHPEEIKAVLQTLSEFYPDESNMVVFQPHLFSRTQDFMEDFAAVLEQFDEIVLMDIYPAREKPIDGVSSDVLLERIKNKNKRKIMDEEFHSTVLQSEADLVLTLGAGDIGIHVQKLKKISINEI